MAQEVIDILNHIKANHHFLLSGGAGSGKTHTLVEVIREVMGLFPSNRIACITYTNAAALEIEHRVNNGDLRVSTIHDFLWDCIKNYQRELKKALICMINDANSKISIKDLDSPLPDDFFDSKENPITIEYREYRKLKEGIISHDEVLAVAQYMFAHSTRLVNIIKSRFPFIFIDEYQDTQPLVIDIFLHSFRTTEQPCVMGFFGDSMQSIYDDGIGNLDSYLHTDEQPNGFIYEVKKVDNYRNPVSVINIANKLRTDSLNQKPTKSPSAKNVVDGVAKEGSAVFYYSEKEDRLPQLYALLENKGWDFNDPKQTKELRLTHNLIAGEAGFSTLHEIHTGDKIFEYAQKVKKVISEDLHLSEESFLSLTFGEVLEFLNTNYSSNKKWKPTSGQNDYIGKHDDAYEVAKSLNFAYFLKCGAFKEDIIDDNYDDVEDDTHTATSSSQSPLIKHLNQIEKCIRYFSAKNYNEFVRCSSFKSIVRFSQKKELKEAIERIISDLDMIIAEVIELADELNICVIDDRLTHYRERNRYVFDRVGAVAYQEFRNLYDYNALQKPFATQHKTKGLEFPNVLVILDNGKWNKYNFTSLFADVDVKPSIVDRTRKLFYVCCTRTEDYLAVYYPNASEEVVSGAKAMFGEDNVVKL